MSDCLDISWLAAWDRWWADQVVADCRLYGGWSIRTWGRVGKVLLLVSAVTLVAEVVGYDRLRQLGDVANYITFRILWFFSGQPTRENWKKMRESNKYAYISGRDMAFIMATFIFSYIVFFVFSWMAENSNTMARFIWSLVAAIGGVVSAFTFLVGIPAFWWWALQHPRLHSHIKSVALVCLLLGFVLDLLAS